MEGYAVRGGIGRPPDFETNLTESFRHTCPLDGKGGAVRRKRFSIEQIVAVLKQAEMGTPVSGHIRHLGITEQTFYRWKQRCTGLESEPVRQFTQPQEENAKLKRLVADLSLDKVMLQDVLSKKL